MQTGERSQEAALQTQARRRRGQRSRQRDRIGLSAAPSSAIDSPWAVLCLSFPIYVLGDPSTLSPSVLGLSWLSSAPVNSSQKRFRPGHAMISHMREGRCQASGDAQARDLLG